MRFEIRHPSPIRDPGRDPDRIRLRRVRRNWHHHRTAGPTAVVPARHRGRRPSILTGRHIVGHQIAATGTLEAVTTVQVGSQVSGTIQSLGADFNSIVKKGQVIARLDPSLFQTQVDSARANLAARPGRTPAGAGRAGDAQAKAGRAHELAERAADPGRPTSRRPTSPSGRRPRRSAVARRRSHQARASLTQAEVNLQKTVITSPIDGIVIARSRGRRPDGGGEPAGADALHAGGRSGRDAGQDQHRRVGSREHSARSGR